MRGGGGGLRHLMYGQRLAVLAVFARGVLALLLAACWGAPANASVFWGGGSSKDDAGGSSLGGLDWPLLSDAGPLGHWTRIVPAAQFDAASTLHQRCIDALHPLRFRRLPDGCQLCPRVGRRRVFTYG